MLLSIDGTNDILNHGNKALQVWQQIYISGHKARQYHAERRIAERVVRRQASIIMKTKASGSNVRKDTSIFDGA